MAVLHAVPRRWSVGDYNRMVELGLLGEHERVELIDGEVLRLLPKERGHAAVDAQLGWALRQALPKDFIVREHLPLDINACSQPEPDFAVVDRLMLEEKPYPRSPYLVIEVPNHCQRYHREVKSALYASAGIEEYWVVKVTGLRGVEVFTEPMATDSGEHPFGYHYSKAVFLGESEQICPLLHPDVRLNVSDLFPKEELS